jgi:nickel-type superoxide dismutase maturation protease
MRRSARHYLVAAAVVSVALWRAVRRVEVIGDSMLPTLQPGDRLLLLRPGPARPGDVVAVVDPRMQSRTMLKRVVDVDRRGVTVLGDNPSASTDSRALGPLAPAAVRGRAFYRYFPAGRRGRL